MIYFDVDDGFLNKELTKFSLTKFWPIRPKRYYIAQFFEFPTLLLDLPSESVRENLAHFI